ncbi:MAG: hypothetical protein R3D98_00615 [Candidatus Krumholzibacteriia bacterium]
MDEPESSAEMCAASITVDESIPFQIDRESFWGRSTLNTAITVLICVFTFLCSLFLDRKGMSLSIESGTRSPDVKFFARIAESLAFFYCGSSIVLTTVCLSVTQDTPLKVVQGKLLSIGLIAVVLFLLLYALVVLRHTIRPSRSFVTVLIHGASFAVFIAAVFYGLPL